MKKILVFLFLFFSFWISSTFAVYYVDKVVYPKHVFYTNWKYLYYKRDNYNYNFYDSKTNELIKSIKAPIETSFSNLYYDNSLDKFYIFSDYAPSYYLESDFTFKEFAKRYSGSCIDWYYRNEGKIKCIDKNYILTDNNTFWILWFLEKWWTLLGSVPYYKVWDWYSIIRGYKPLAKTNWYDISDLRINWILDFWNMYWVSSTRFLITYEENFKVKVLLYDFKDKKIIYQYDWLSKWVWNVELAYDYNCFFRLSVGDKVYTDTIQNCKWGWNIWTWWVDGANAWADWTIWKAAFKAIEDFIEKEKPWDEIVNFVKNYKDFVTQNHNITNPEVWKKVSDFVSETVKELNKLWTKWELAAKAVMSSYYNILVNTWKINWSWAAKSIDSVLNYIKERDKKNSDYSWNSKIVNSVVDQMKWSSTVYQINKLKYKWFQTCSMFDDNLKFIYNWVNKKLVRFDLKLSDKFDVLLLKPFFYLIDLIFTPLTDILNDSITFLSVFYPFPEWDYCFLGYVYNLEYQSYLWIWENTKFLNFFPEKNFFDKWKMNFLDYFFLFIFWLLVVKIIILIFNKNQ